MRRYWSNLPEMALISIAQFADSRFDVIHIRSVCSNWRRNVPPPPKSPKLPMLLYFYDGDCVREDHVLSAYKLSKTTVFLLEEPRTTEKWLVSVSESNFGRKLCLLNPFSSRPIGEAFPEYAFPEKAIDLLELRVTEVSKRYSLRFITEIDEADDRENQNMELDLKLLDESDLKHDVCFKAMLSDDDFNRTGSFLLLDDLAKLRGVNVSGDYWETVCDKAKYRDIAVHNDYFFCVDGFGTVIGVDMLCYEADHEIPAPEAIFGEWYFVRASEDLYLVGRDFRACGSKLRYDTESRRFVARPGCGPLPVKFQVYMLDCEDPEIPKWVKVDDLDDYIFFVSRHGSYAIDHCPLLEGNYIIYIDEIEYEYYDDDHDNLPPELFEYAIQELDGVKVGRYDFMEGSSVPLSQCPDHLEMFWPPPEWLMMKSSSAACSAGLVEEESSTGSN